MVLEAGAAVLARGGRGGEPDGGPGSGGVIVIEAPELRVARGATVSAAGGGRVGLGRLRLTRDPSRCTLEGGFSPPLQRGCAESRAMGFAYVSAWR